VSRLISAEALKLRSTRTLYAITLGALALIAIAVAVAAALSNFKHGDHPGRDTLSIAGVAHTFALLLGVLAVTNEFRYGTITPALLITPKRTPLLTAKAINLLRAGLVFGLLAFGTATSIVLPVLCSRDISSQLDSADVARIVAGGTIATALFAALGVGIGAVGRNQVGAIVAALCLLYAVEPLLTFIPGLGDMVQKFGLGGLSSAASGTTGFQSKADLLGQAPAALVLASYALVALVAGATLLRRRDVTA
jgi:ABC-2 type transport system permease protein